MTLLPRLLQRRFGPAVAFPADFEASRFRWKTFRDSPLGAQCWFEWRQSLFWVPLLTGVILACLVLFIPIPFGILASYHHPYEVLMYQAIVVTTFIPGMLAFGVGYQLLRWTPSYWTFVGTRPMSVKTIAQAKLLTGTVAVLPACLMALLLFGASPIVPDPGPVWWEYVGYSVGMLFLGTWCSLFLGRLAVLYYGVLNLVLLLMFWLDLRRGDILDMLPMYAPLPVILLAALAWSAWRGWIPARAIQFILILLALLAVLILRNASTWDVRTIYTACVMTLVFLPLAWVPITVDWNRHR